MSERLDDYNVAWDSPSKDSSGSMPLGNGDIGLNVWAEPGAHGTGEVVLLIGKTDAWDENSTNLKLGRVRLRFSPGSIDPFRQTLLLRTGDIEMVLGKVTVRIWVDANHPVIHVEAAGDGDFEMSAKVEIWRTEERVIKTQTGDLFRNLSGKDPYPTVVSPDAVQADDETILWWHHNGPREHDGYEINMRLQGLGDYIGRSSHPLRGRTFGAAIEGPGFRIVNNRALVSEPAKAHRLSIYALTKHPATPEQWIDSMRQIIAAEETADHASNRRAHERWWNEFWDRSEITIHAPPASEAFHVAQGYTLQRFMNACGGRGAQPIKFNGSNFTVGRSDERGEDPDFRRWGGPGFWFMNMRLIYWPMLASGDFDLMRPWLRMYLDMLPLQRHRTHTYYGHGGAHYPETITFWGAEVSAHYGWTPFDQRSKPEAECSYVTYYWTCGIELSLVLWTFFSYTGDETFAREFLLPIADAVTEFFDLHYPRDAAGKIRFEPAQALETWQDATNPLPEIAGLRYLLPKLIELPAYLADASLRDRWRRMVDALPPIPVGEKDGRRVMLPAQRFDKLKNTENPELYAIFPFRLFGVGKPDLQLARDTFAVRLHPSHDCWSQDDVQMAYLGLAEQAKEFVTKRAAPASHSDSRFPAFWNAFHDWVPDMDHGGVLQLALQAMLMQCEGNEIRLLPAWPTEWDADFKLHAPRETIVQGKVRGGKVVDLCVTPEARRVDVVLPGS